MTTQTLPATPTTTCPTWCVDHTPETVVEHGGGQFTLTTRGHEATLITLDVLAAGYAEAATVALRIDRAEDPHDGWAQTQVALLIDGDGEQAAVALTVADLRALGDACHAAADLYGQVTS